MTKYAVIGFAFLASVIGAFFYGQHVANDHNKAQVLAVQQQAIKAANIQAAKDQARDIASANQIAALQVANESLQQQISSATLTGGNSYVAPVSPLCPTVLNPLSSPVFVRLYNAGSRGEALPASADNLPASKP
jgi:hypothetical protein